MLQNIHGSVKQTGLFSCNPQCAFFPPRSKRLFAILYLLFVTDHLNEFLIKDCPYPVKQEVSGFFFHSADEVHFGNKWQERSYSVVGNDKPMIAASSRQPELRAVLIN